MSQKLTERDIEAVAAKLVSLARLVEVGHLKADSARIAEVHVDEEGADVLFTDTDTTVHVRL